jgi:hypothetical protein
MSDIFYSQVDSNLWKELNARGTAGKLNRGTKDLQFMLEKVANVAIVPYKLDPKNPDNKYPISEAILGGNTVRGGEYLPGGINGFLADRSYSITTYGVDSQKPNPVKEDLVNKSKRTPPFITSMDLSIGDHSMGLLNSVTINITIPNPERDLNFIESVYFRPGRNVTVIIEHPESAILSGTDTGGRLSDETLPSLDALAKQQKVSKDILIKNLERFRKLNSVCFDGLITSFTFDYQTDASVLATLNIMGTSNVYTDVSLIISSQENNKDSQRAADETTAFSSFYKNLLKEVDAEITKVDADEKFANNYVFVRSVDGKYHYGVRGVPRPGLQSEKYIQLTWLVDYINRVVLSKLKNTVPQSNIIFSADNDLCISNYYPNLVSCNPKRLFLSERPNRTYKIPNQTVTVTSTNATGSIITEELPTDKRSGWYIGTNKELGGFDFLTFSEAIVFLTREKTTDTSWTFSSNINGKQVYRPTGIFINMEVIQEIVDGLTVNQTLTVSSLLDAVSSEVYKETGYAINLKLITHPEDASSLLWYDCNAITGLNSVKPYPVPMFANHPLGTIVRDFKFSGKLPQDATNLAYVLNSDPSEIAESNIAPFVSFMYTANTVDRTGPNESISSVITDEELAAIKKKYQEAHIKYKEAYFDARTQLSENYLSTALQASLESALQKHIQYPTPTIQESNELAAPVIPFDVEFTTDGVNGFRYGDILTFDGLPDRYKRNAVFCVISITHNVGQDGIWTTTVRCIMRPKID